MISLQKFVSWILFVTVVSSVSIRGSEKKNQFLVPKLPGLQDLKDDEIPLMFAGQLELYKENNTHLFFWKYSDQNILPQYKKRTIFWLNGGPGCSSMDGALMEAGPFRISADKKVTVNKGSWHHAGDLVFVDQPAGTGFSYTKEYDHDLDQVAFQFIKFMELYYEMFPEDEQNEIYFAGESYAGQYIPYIADAILKRNKSLKDGQKPYDLKGLLIGNGWIAPDSQSLSYLPYSLAAGIIDTENDDWKSVIRQHEKCQNVVNNVKGDTLDDFQVVSDTCEQILNLILSATRDRSAPEYEQCYNMYDYTLKDSYPSCGMNWPPDLDNVGPFLNTEEVQNDLNLIMHKTWHECSGKVGGHFTARNSVPAIKLLPGILEQIPIVLFNGNRDIICNYIGTENFIKQLQWNGATGFEQEDAFDWVYDDAVTGYVKTERNLTFVNVFDSSHMVPFDLPEVSRSLIDLLVGNYDIKSVGTVGGAEKRAIVTYPLGERKQEQPVQEQVSSSVPTGTSPSSSTPVATSVVGSWAQFGSSTPSPASSRPSGTTAPSQSETETEPESGTSRITRIIQFVVLVILVWGIYVLYAHYRSGPSSIIKTKPSSRKKNVQWADQLRQFQEDDQITGQSFLSKAFNKLKRTDGRGQYAPTNDDEYLEDIEMDSALNGVDQFIIDSDDEQPPPPPPKPNQTQPNPQPSPQPEPQSKD